MKFTLFTPVFNREAVLHRVWTSIKAQTYSDFEWVCVNDGSQDRSLLLLEEYRRDASFPVTIINHAKNQGKHVAWNRAVEVAKGELFVPCDSDDEFDAEALAFFDSEWNAVPAESKAAASGINVLCRDALTNAIIGDRFPKSPMWANNLELFYGFGVTGEKWGCVRTDLLRRFKFPESQGYFGESYLWYSIARSHRALCFNKPLRTYYRDQGNSISATIPRIAKLPAMYEYACWHICENYDYIRLRPIRLLGEGSNVFLRALLLGLGYSDPRSRLKHSQAARIWVVFALLGTARYYKSRLLARWKGKSRSR